MAIKLGMDLKTSLSQTLTPQQIQYLKLLQLPVMQFEQYLEREIESNPMLEEEMHDGLGDGEAGQQNDSATVRDNSYEYDTIKKERSGLQDDDDPFELYKMIWQDDSTYKQVSYSNHDEEEGEPFQIQHRDSLQEELMRQFELLDLTKEESLLGVNFIGNIEDDGYLRREVDEIINETNSQIAEHNFKQQQQLYQKSQNNTAASSSENPALRYMLESTSREQLDTAEKLRRGEIDFSSDRRGRLSINTDSAKELNLFKPVDSDTAEKVLYQIRRLDPPGIGSRNVRECLLSQLDIVDRPTPEEDLAYDILKNSYETFVKKHYDLILKKYGIGEEALRSVLEVITSLNPKPGGSDFYEQTNSVVPDFILTIDDETDEINISINDGHTPTLKLSKAYESMKKEAEYKDYNKDTKTWIRSKHEDAKFLIQAIRQRKNTMVKVITAIAHRQKEFFIEGGGNLKPMIYKDIAEDTGLDISTVCRIVNGKYVQTGYGTFELKYFFSEALPSADGEDVSTRVIKKELEEIINKESKKKPYSDEKLSKMLNERGYQVARRTVAKYREQLKIPVARLRKEI